MAKKKTIHLLDHRPGSSTKERTVKPDKDGNIIIGDGDITWADVLSEAHLFSFNRWEHSGSWSDVRPDWLVPFDDELAEAQRMIRTSGLPHWRHATGSYRIGEREGIMAWLEDEGIGIMSAFVSTNMYGQIGIWSEEDWQTVYAAYMVWCVGYGVDVVSKLDTRFAYECGRAYRMAVS